MIAGTVRDIDKKMKVMPKYPTWAELKAMFNQNLLIEEVSVVEGNKQSHPKL